MRPIATGFSRLREKSPRGPYIVGQEINRFYRRNSSATDDLLDFVMRAHMTQIQENIRGTFGLAKSNKLDFANPTDIFLYLGHARAHDNG